LLIFDLRFAIAICDLRFSEQQLNRIKPRFSISSQLVQPAQKQHKQKHEQPQTSGRKREHQNPERLPLE